ncbi:hypothetical protein BRD00_05325 [Halobacteriales archaeon QS_8_69_26]|nr:MAG: hypothetical protein BRD00_05325 [Halobacteriales archaeon QS_8_69_26]
MIGDHDELVPLLDRIMTDYRDRRDFFGGRTLPANAVLEETAFADRPKALYLTFTCVTDHIHNVIGRTKQKAGEDGLWWVCARLLQNDPWLFDPAELVGNDRRSDLETRFKRIDLMDGRDPDWWYRTATILDREFDSDPRNLLQQYDYDAVRLEAAITGRYDFPGLWGRKNCPRWLRLMNDEIHGLENLEAIDVPVDFHIVNVVAQLVEAEIDPRDEEDEEVARQLWREVCDRQGYAPVQLELPVRLLNRDWHAGGQEYVDAITDSGPESTVAADAASNVRSSPN